MKNRILFYPFCLLFYALAACMFRDGCRAVKQGVIHYRGTHTRKEEPLSFWLSVVMVFVLSVFLFVCLTGMILIDILGEPGHHTHG